MFDLKRPCTTCPFRRSTAPSFGLNEARLREIFEATAFQCHTTIDYAHEGDPKKQQGRHPQQCAGLMVLLHRVDQPNQIMQVAQRLVGFDASQIETTDTFTSLAEAVEAHTAGARRR